MKTLSLKEPWATLIEEGQKRIETRSWKTNYRGPLLIHASLSKIDKDNPKIQELMKLIQNKELNYGKIICKCELIDCIPMDENFLNEISKNPQEKLCGEYALGRFAWILSNIEPLEESIPIKGHLGLWEYKEDKHAD